MKGERAHSDAGEVAEFVADLGEHLADLAVAYITDGDVEDRCDIGAVDDF